MLLDLLTSLTRRYVCPLVAVAGLSACDETPQYPGPTSGELESMIALHCESVDTCGCGAEIQSEGCERDLKTRWSARSNNGQRLQLTYDAECFASLQSKIEEYQCYWPGGSTPLCQDFCAVYHGDKPLGAACDATDEHVSDCAQGLLCDQAVCTDPCAALTGRQLGERCGDNEGETYDDCAVGMTCDWEIGRCIALPGLGDFCDNTGCGAGLTCHWSSGVCVLTAAEGEDCEDVECGDGLYCDWREGPNERGEQICTPYAAQGQACGNTQCGPDLFCFETEICNPAPGPGQQCLWGSQCDDQSTCDFDSNRCVVLPEAGSACASGRCAMGSWCQTSPEDPDGTCSLPVTNGEMCSGHTQCQSGYCPNGFCFARPGDGDDCTQVGVCAPRLVCNGATCEPTYTRAPAACTYRGW